MNRGTDFMMLAPGIILPYAGSVAPATNTGWLLCNGAAISRSTYAALFAAIGTTYGPGDGSSTFNVPDLRGRAIVGEGQGSSLTNRALGATGGAETHVLDTTQIPAHGHPARISSASAGTAQSMTTGGLMLNTINNSNQAEHTGTPAATLGQQIGGTGGGQAHNNMQPFATLRYLIKY